MQSVRAGTPFVFAYRNCKPPNRHRCACACIKMLAIIAFKFFIAFVYAFHTHSQQQQQRQQHKQDRIRFTTSFLLLLRHLIIIANVQWPHTHTRSCNTHNLNKPPAVVALLPFHG